MRNFPFIILIFFTLVLHNAYADDLFPDTGFRFKDRAFEMGINANGFLSGNFLKTWDIIQGENFIDLDTLAGRLDFYTGIDASPFYINVTGNKGGGWGLSFNVNSFGSFELSEDDKDKSNAAFAIFADASMDFIFKIDHVKVKLKPSAFITAMYVQPEISYTFSDTPSLNLEYNSRVYTSFKIDDLDNIRLNLNTLSGTPGMDVSIRLEYPLSRATGLYKKFALFDFDIGIDIINIPIIASTMKHYIETTGVLSLEGDTIEDFIDIDIRDLFQNPVYREEKILAERPFRSIFWMNWRLFGSHLFTLSPHIGFSVNPLYLHPFTTEYGLKVKLDLANILIITAGTRYEDRFWKTGAGLTINLRVIELNVGADFVSSEMFDVLNADGLGIFVGLKFGY